LQTAIRRVSRPAVCDALVTSGVRALPTAVSE
jgi:hypothetical protein